MYSEQTEWYYMNFPLLIVGKATVLLQRRIMMENQKEQSCPGKTPWCYLPYNDKQLSRRPFIPTYRDFLGYILTYIVPVCTANTVCREKVTKINVLCQLNQLVMLSAFSELFSCFQIFAFFVLFCFTSITVFGTQILVTQNEVAFYNAFISIMLFIQ